MARSDSLRLPLRLLALVIGGSGAWMAASPASFHEALADFGAYDPHGLRDTATFMLAAGVLLWVAADRVSWRAPVIALVALQNALHTLNHLLDVGDAHPGWVGPLDLAMIGALTAMLVWAFRQAETAS